jgi:hypothetical protein
MVGLTSFCHGSPLDALEIKDVSHLLEKKLQVQAVDEIQPIVNLGSKAGTEQLILLADRCSIAKDDPPGLNWSEDLSRDWAYAEKHKPLELKQQCKPWVMRPGTLVPATEHSPQIYQW